MFEAAAFRNEKQETHKVVFPCYSVISVAVLISLLLANFAALALFLNAVVPAGLQRGGVL